MFSVDNFYTIFNSYYGYPEKNNTLRVFAPHGSKDWNNCITWAESGQQFSNQNLMSMGAFIMHDQEPFSISQLLQYLDDVTSDEKFEEFKSQRPLSTGRYQTYHSLGKHLNPFEILHLTTNTTKFPIFCHSEKNSKDIDQLKDNNVIPCYYWWHGMIARDWYRHWEHHNALNVHNKASTANRFLIYSRAFDGTREYRRDIINHLQRHSNLVNYNWNNDARCATLSATIDIADANNSAIHLVAETLFDTDKIYLTEKVFKPMVMSQPFILFAPPGSLQYLRDYGFKTFDTFWSEDYDLINNSTERRKTILHLIDSLAAMPQNQFRELYQELLPIVEHNRQRFYSNEFQQDLWNELQRNCSDALQKQQELSEQHYGGSWFYYLNQFLTKNPVPLTDYWKSLIHSLLEHNKIDRVRLLKEYPTLARFI